MLGVKIENCTGHGARSRNRKLYGALVLGVYIETENCTGLSARGRTDNYTGLVLGYRNRKLYGALGAPSAFTKFEAKRGLNTVDKKIKIAVLKMFLRLNNLQAITGAAFSIFSKSHINALFVCSNIKLYVAFVLGV